MSMTNKKLQYTVNIGRPTDTVRNVRCWIKKELLKTRLQSSHYTPGDPPARRGTCIWSSGKAYHHHNLEECKFSRRQRSSSQVISSMGLWRYKYRCKAGCGPNSSFLKSSHIYGSSLRTSLFGSVHESGGIWAADQKANLTAKYSSLVCR